MQGFRLVLASASPRRRELLAQAGFVFAVEAADVDESPRAGEEAAAYVGRLAEEKARAVFARRAHPTHRDDPCPMDAVPAKTIHRDGTATGSASGNDMEESLVASTLALDEDKEHGPLIVLGADTTVVLDGEILGKPMDAAEARRMLRRLSGRTHQVLTGVAVATRAGVVRGVETTEVVFAQIPDAELDEYCATDEPLDKAGAYGIQGYAARWISRIDGDYFNVMGLPIARVVRMIEEALARKAKSDIQTS